MYIGRGKTPRLGTSVEFEFECNALVCQVRRTQKHLQGQRGWFPANPRSSTRKIADKRAGVKSKLKTVSPPLISRYGR